MNTWHVDYSRPGWLCPDCRWDTAAAEAAGPDRPRLVEPCDLHGEAMSLRSSA
jgi:hypothetical protein